MIDSADRNRGERASSTAWLVAYMRTFSDIPFSSEVFQELQTIGSHAPTIEEQTKLKTTAPVVEARSKMPMAPLGFCGFALSP